MVKTVATKAGSQKNVSGPVELEALEADIRAKAAKGKLADRIGGIAYPLGTVIVLLVVWQLVVQIFGIATYLMPTPVDVAHAMVEHFDRILQNSGITVAETVIGFGLSIVVGVPLGLGLAMSPIFSRCFYPLLVGSNALPKVAIAPLFVVWLGFGLPPKVFVAFLIAFFPIVINTVVGLSLIEKEKIHLARSMGMSATATFFKIRLPQALPVIFGGIKVASSLAVIGAIVGEFVGADSGLGKLLLDANANLQTPLLFAVFIVLTVFSVALFGAVQIAERLTIPWHSSIRNKAGRGADG
jgi:NitT/TauT family transport system permease protein